MKIISWNFHGVGCTDTIRKVIRLIRDERATILFLMETRVPSSRARRIMRHSHFTNIASVEAMGFSGGLWCFWDASSVGVHILSYTSQLMNIGIMHRNAVD